jgi:hypothetical protein
MKREVLNQETGVAVAVSPSRVTVTYHRRRSTED